MALVLAIGMMPCLNGTASSHAPLAFMQAGSAGHLALDADSHEHGHDHDDGSPDGQHRHFHGHNPTDHSHETGAPIITIAAAEFSQLRLWKPQHGTEPASAPPSRLERPPRESFAS
jgi:hypothetical protein